VLIQLGLVWDALGHNECWWCSQVTSCISDVESESGFWPEAEVSLKGQDYSGHQVKSTSAMSKCLD